MDPLGLLAFLGTSGGVLCPMPPAVRLPWASGSPPPVSESKNMLIRESYGRFRARKAIWVKPTRAPPIRPPTPAPTSQVHTPPTAFARPALSHTAPPTPIEMPRGRGRPSWGHNASHVTGSMVGSLVRQKRPLASATTARHGARHHEGHSLRVAHV